MGSESQYHESQGDNDDVYYEGINNYDDECKIFVSRIHASFDEDTVVRLIEDKLGGGGEKGKPSVVTECKLVYPRNDEEDGNDEADEEGGGGNSTASKEQHRGFGFVILASRELRDEALKLGTIRGGAKAKSTRKHTIYLRPVSRVAENEDNSSGKDDDRNLCFLWTKFRCPYGNDCKFEHRGEGGCLEKTNTGSDPSSPDSKKKKKKCFNFKKGKCKLGDECPFSHDFDVTKKKQTVEHAASSRSQCDKDCINWKTKARCKRKEKGTCPYRHDEEIRQKAIERKQSKKRKGPSVADATVQKLQQPLSIRVFGMNYETTEDDIRAFFQDCGRIVDVTFPTFEDSGRSKGYCGVLFQSPKAVAKAVELDGAGLHGRWLSIQAGKMYLKQWEERESQSRHRRDAGPALETTPIEIVAPAMGEFGQRVKRRKKHGFKE